MQQSKFKALRYNEGKPQLSYILSARYAVEGVAKVMEYGATKYTKYLLGMEDLDLLCRRLSNAAIAVELCESLQKGAALAATINIGVQWPNVLSVTELEDCIARANANPVMNGNGLAVVLNNKKESKPISGNIGTSLSSESEKGNVSGVDEKILSTSKPSPELVSSRVSRSTELPRSSTSEPVNEDVKSAAQKRDCTLTITTGQACLGVFCVENVIKDLDFLMTIHNVLSKLPTTSRLSHKGWTVELTNGRDNWKRGLSVENCVDSLLRHLTKYLDGETHDDESGCHHLDHVATNALFLAFHHNGRKPND